jgi:hypothetical protein
MYSFDLPYLCAMISGAVLAIATHPLVKRIFLLVIRGVARRSLTEEEKNTH